MTGELKAVWSVKSGPAPGPKSPLTGTRHQGRAAGPALDRLRGEGPDHVRLRAAREADLKLRVRHGLRDQPQHAAHALEVGERENLVSENREQPWMEWVTAQQPLTAVLARAGRGKAVRVRGPQGAVGVNDLCGASVVNPRK
jgi:hypothetical protein